MNKNAIVRLHKYRSVLRHISDLGVLKVFSTTLADAIGVTSAQVRKDFSVFKISGNKRGGYQIESLLANLDEVLGKDKLQKVIVVGVGNIGKALLNYDKFVKDGIEIVGAFDIDPVKVNEGHWRVPIMPLEEMKDFAVKNDVTTGIISVNEGAAQQVTDLMIATGIKGILNFAPIRLKVPKGIVVNNVNLRLELETVAYFVGMEAKRED